MTKNTGGDNLHTRLKQQLTALAAEEAFKAIVVFIDRAQTRISNGKATVSEDLQKEIDDFMLVVFAASTYIKDDCKLPAKPLSTILPDHPASNFSFSHFFKNMLKDKI